MIKKYFLFFAILASLRLGAQDMDTLSVMTYNLLFYGANFGNCNTNTNALADKDGYLETIARHVEPDILLVNELGTSSIFSERILANSLNTQGVDHYARAEVQNNGFSSIVNQCFYNSDKLELVDQYSIDEDVFNNSLVRVIDVYTLQYKDPNLTAESDTVFVKVLAAHFKAGSSASDETDRELAAEAIMNNLSAGETAYYILTGDLNLKDSNEPAFGELTSNTYGDYRFYDPINSLGNWNNNGNFAGIHTQSTRNSNTNSGCFSGGGMDDRFDIIMMSGQVIEDTGLVSYVENSYYALGQDGQHFNGEINAGTNNSAPTAVIDALYEMSDHLPVIAELKVKKEVDATGVSSVRASKIRMQQRGKEITLSNLPTASTIQLMNLQGAVLKTQSIVGTRSTISLADREAGVYLLRVGNERDARSFKVVNLH